MAKQINKNSQTKDDLDFEVDQLLELAKSKKFESGIYNFCDRWCEKCPDTAKCFLYAKTQMRQGQKILAGKVSDDIHDQLEDVKHSFAVTERLLARKCQEKGIDISRISEESDKIKSWDDDFEKNYKQMPISKLAKKYMKACHEFLKKFHESRLAYLPTLGLEIDYSEVKDEIEIITWYATMLPAKIWSYYYDLEAYRLEQDKGLKEMMAADLPKMFDLVARCLGKSLEAWKSLEAKRDDLNMEIKKFIVLLDKIKGAVGKYE